ncbi:MAG: uracil phosphoribosyltransferase [Firmicutes bacterium]|nr:uracil phosphoribosyltransferase [Bacillota bacterium]MDD4264310.1 uracil phosphoribosyltransferase [Bacillota bacterium]MDD4693591.1 uracil phosphoribosyltransferase [Bacillota bacterium]
MSDVFVFDHPLIQHKLSIIRDVNTGCKEFRELVNEISMLMAYEVTKDMALEPVDVQTPVAKAKCQHLAGPQLAVVPVLRAGLGMVDGILDLIPNARVGHIGVYRDPETLKPVEYYCKLPSDIGDRHIIVVDPMLATGGSATASINFIKARGGKHIRLMNLIAAPEGIEAVQKAHPDVNIYVAGLDSHLNEDGYIIPGLGDAGDRLFGTK